MFEFFSKIYLRLEHVEVWTKLQYVPRYISTNNLSEETYKTHAASNTWYELCLIVECLIAYMKGELINMTQEWDKEKIWFPEGIKPMTSWALGGQFIHLAKRTHGKQDFFVVPHSFHGDQFTFHRKIHHLYSLITT